MASIAPNNLLAKRDSGQLCRAFGVRLVTNPQIVQLAHNAGYDALWVDMEHSTLSLFEASLLCSTALQIGITPFVRVPYHCGDGFVQRVLDGGAMGVIFPHIHNKHDAEAAVAISKYPPLGRRSMTGQLPVFGLKPTTLEKVITETNQQGSTVFLMIETKDSIRNIDEIASVERVDVLLVGSNDLSIELGIPGQFESDKFRDAVQVVSDACRRHGKVLGLAGIYDDCALLNWVVHTLRVGFLLGQQDSGLLAKGAKANVSMLERIHNVDGR